MTETRDIAAAIIRAAEKQNNDIPEGFPAHSEFSEHYGERLKDQKQQYEIDALKQSLQELKDTPTIFASITLIEFFG